MSATDELRRMLDERGVEYVPNMFGITWGYYSDAHTAAESMDGTLIVTGLTPGQAIAATLGVETCSNKRGRCSACGSIMYDAPNYCPNCGRKVES